MTDENNDRPLSEQTTRPVSPSADDRGTIGPYRILDKLGEGGMGEVYRAEQETPVRRTVALKIIKWGMDTKQVVARFESERQALALMNHPNIARVFDAGATERGRPYFAMEYVKGVPITRYCDLNRLGTRERLELFKQVCAGVQHAHQKGVIHRDIKPSNVLVKIQNDEPVPKIIDFGVAKAIDRRLTTQTVFTELGQLIGTPEYMSPEQAEMSSLDIDTRTDVYSLGVVLYELLAGVLPFDPRELRRAGLAEIQRRIREEEPPRPSTRVSGLGGESTSVAAQRRTEPATLVRRLRGDLDWITMKALEKDRTRRYGSPMELAADIDRHLGHQPVVAGQPTASYRVKKFVRRHKVGVALTALLATLLVGFTAVTAVQSARVARERDRAEQEAAKAGAINEFLQQTLGSASPFEGLGLEATILEALDAATEKIQQSFGDEPAIEAAVRNTIGLTYFELGRFEEAEPLLLSALKTRERVLGAEHPDVAQSLHNLGLLRWQTGRLDEAETLIRRGLEMRRELLGEKNPDVAFSLADLVNVLEHQDRLDEAEAVGREVLELRRRLFGAEHVKVAQVSNDLGWVLYRKGGYDEAEKLLRQALNIYRNGLGEEHPRIATTMTNLANVLESLGRVDKAEPLLREALDMRRKLLGEDHPHVAWGLTGLADLLRAKGDYLAAETMLLQALELRRRTLGEVHNDVASTLSFLAFVKNQQGDVAAQEAYERQSLETYRQLGDAARPSSVATALQNLALTLTEKGDDTEAEALFLQAMAIEERLSELDPYYIANTKSNYAACLTNLGRYVEAEEQLLAAHPVLESQLGEDHWRTQKALNRLVALYEAWGKPQRAAAYRAMLTPPPEPSSSR